MREWLARIVDWVRRDRLEAELAEELRFHQAQLERDARAAGTPAGDAESTARRKLGNVTRIREDARDRWSLPWLDRLEQDVRYAARGFRRSPGFALVVVLTLGLGIGANAAIFSTIDRMLLRPPALLRDPALTHRVYASYPLPDGSGNDFVLDVVPYVRYTELTAWTRSFSRTAAHAHQTLAVGTGEEAREMPVAAVTASFFGFFDAPPVLGRYFAAPEDLPPSGTPVAVLSYGMWQTRFAGRPGVLGAALQIGPTVYTVIGVAARGLVGLWPEQPPVAFIPLSASVAADVGHRREPWWTSSTMHVAAMLVTRKPGVTIAAASADLTAAMLRTWKAPPPLTPRVTAASILSERGPSRTGTARVAALVGGMALVVLVIAGANVANLLLARALRRRREIAVRLALGVSRGRLLSHLLTESVLLALLGGCVGLLIAQWGGSALRAAFLPPGVESPVMTDTRTLIFVGAAVLILGLVAGMAPAWQTRRVDLAHQLKAGARDGIVQRSPARVALLVMQGALSVLLLVGAALFVRSLANVNHVRLGYDADRVLAVDLRMRGTPLDSARAAELRERLMATARRIPGVARAALTLHLPFQGMWLANIEVPGADSATRLKLTGVWGNAVSPEYFETMGTRILRGRGIDAGDVAGAPGAAVLSASLAELLWPGKDPLGRCVTFGLEPNPPCSYVVGVAENMESTRLGDDPGLGAHLSAAQRQVNQTGLIVRTRGDAADHAAAIRQALQREMPGASYVTVTPLSAILREATRSWRVGAIMFVAFGFLALVLAAVGLYGVVSYNVAQRIHEMGVRRALGAQAGHVVRLVVRQGVLLAAVGVAIGAMLAFAAAGQIGPLLFEVSPRDPAVYAIVGGAMLAVAVAASVIPARRAARVDPNMALRAE